jgi:hypothetical protein
LIFGEPEEVWFGGREGHTVFDDDWVADRSWHFYKCVQRSQVHNLDVYVNLKVFGAHKGRCTPRKAIARLSLGPEKHGWFGPKIDLGSISIRSLVQAQKWADLLATTAAIKVLYQTFYSTFELVKKGVLFEAFDKELGWHEWFWAFDPYFRDLPPGSYRTIDHEGRVSLLRYEWSSWSSTSWPSRWERLARPLGWKQAYRPV